jgi:polyhydroxybutyrate depolymerase
MTRAPLWPSLFLLALACKSPAEMPDAEDLRPQSPLLIARPYDHKVPASYDPARPTPLVIVLHGYGANGAGQDAYFGICRLGEERGYLCAYPDGTVDAQGKQFWNATDACCDFGGKGVDDVAYLDAVIDDMSARYNVDPRRIFLIGHSNGGFMAHRMACDRAGRIAGIVSLAGATWKDPQRCRPAAPVAVLQAHGDMDEAVPYGGGDGIPSAGQSVAFWAAQNRCAATPAPPDPRRDLDLDSAVEGPETSVQRHPGCQGGAAELWTLRGSSHLPRLGAAWARAVYDFLAARPRP